jgi:hypothetical protein
MHNEWLVWTAVIVLILLQLTILVLIAGRPRAVAVLAFGLPVLCGLCAIGASAIILYYMDLSLRVHTRAGSASAEGYPHYLMPLLYVIWGICGLVALVTVVLCVIAMRRKEPVPEEATNKLPLLEEARNNP